MEGVVEALKAETELRQNQYLNHVIEQDHRNVKRSVKPMMGFKSFFCIYSSDCGSAKTQTTAASFLNGLSVNASTWTIACPISFSSKQQQLD